MDNTYNGVGEPLDNSYELTTYINKTIVDNQTDSGVMDTQYHTSLPSDIDIFSNIPIADVEWPIVRTFFSLLRDKLLDYSITDKTLSKLVFTENTTDIKSFDWVFNYFRISISFSSSGDNSYCLIETNVEDRIFLSKCAEFKEQDIEQVTEEIVRYVINRI